MYKRMNDVEENTQVNDAMDFDEFAETIRATVEGMMDKSAQVMLHTISKVNRPKVKTLSILYSGENTSPAVELEPYYNNYQKGSDVKELAEQIIAFCRETGVSGRTDTSFYADFEQAKEHIVCRLINTVLNEELLESVPHLPFQDLALVYYYQADNQDVSGKWSILVRNELLAIWGISQEQLHEVAIANTKKDSFQIIPLSQVLQKLLGFAEPQEECEQAGTDEVLEAESPMYILTNEEMCYGAVGIYFEDTLRKVGSQIGGDYYVLPSSLHECIILPARATGCMQADQLQEMVREVNQKTVGIDELLGDSVYRYDAQKEELTIAA